MRNGGVSFEALCFYSVLRPDRTGDHAGVIHKAVELPLGGLLFLAGNAMAAEL
jgi:hypothetical protein